MAASDLVAGTVMDLAASMMNDTAKTVYTYAVQIPYLQMAMQELREYFELHSVSVTQQVSAIIPVDAGFTVIVYNGLTSPTLPSDMVEPLQLWESNRGQNSYIPMARKDFIPPYFEEIQVSSFGYYTWNGQEIKLPASTQNNDVKIDYIKQLFAPLVDQTSIINVINAQSFLEYRTAGLMAEFIERNITSANALNNNAILALDRVTGISAKSRQTIMTRRKPFRGSYKRGGWT